MIDASTFRLDGRLALVTGSSAGIGFALAQMELTLIISRLAQRLDLTPTAGETPHPVGMVVNRPTGGAPFLVSARSGT